MRAGFIVAATVTLAALAAGGWWLASDRERAPGAATVVIYLVDALRADRLGTYGYERPTSPRLDSLARSGVVFEQASAPSPWTLPSVASLLTSTFSCEHGVISERTRLNPELETLAERLAARDFFTAALHANNYVGPMAGLNRGYEFFSEWQNEGARDVASLLDAAGDRPSLFYLHTIEPHQPHVTPYGYIEIFGHVGIDARLEYARTRQEWAAVINSDWMSGRPVGTTDNSSEQAEYVARLNALRDDVDVLYDAAVRRADRNIGQVIDLLKQRGIWDDTLFIVLADHGEEFGEHGSWTHGHSVYEELTRVPLIVRFPRDQFAGQRIETPVSLVDVMPTIFDYLQEPELCDSCRGRSLLKLLQNKSAAMDQGMRVTAMRINRKWFFRPFKESRGDVNVVIRDGYWKGIWNAEHAMLELYDLRSDPAERANIADAYPSIANGMSAAASEWLADCETNRVQPEEITELPENIKRKLRALGYLN